MSANGDAERRRGVRERLSIMTLHVVAVRGHSTWWIWAIRDTAGAHIEESAMQFASAAAAHVHGNARVAELKKDRQGRSATNS
jgi:hypothetical protein